MVTMPLVDLCLQAVPLGEQALVFRAQCGPNVGQAMPKVVRFDAGSRRDLLNQ